VKEGKEKGKRLKVKGERYKAQGLRLGGEETWKLASSKLKAQSLKMMINRPG
jgi:hypothetical protein